MVAYDSKKLQYLAFNSFSPRSVAVVTPKYNCCHRIRKRKFMTEKRANKKKNCLLRMGADREVS